MPKMKSGLAALNALQAGGATKLFGLMGSSTLELFDALYDRKDIEYVGVRHENCGMHMADAYGRVTQTPGVFICGQAGPGSANMVLGLAQAKMAYSPVVVITGLPSTQHLGRDAFQEIDQNTLFLPVTKRVMTVPRSERIPEFIVEAFRIANSGRRGPVVVNIPRDLFNFDVDVTVPEGLPEIAAPSVDRTALERVKQLILSSKAPVIHAGAGVKWGRGTHKLLMLAEKMQIPITNSAGHTDVIPVDHPLWAGGVGPRGNPVASALTREADLILALGTRLGFNTTFYQFDDISRNAKIVHVDIDPIALGRHFPIALGIAGDAGSVAGALAELMDPISPAHLPWKARNDKFLRDKQQLLEERERAGASTKTPLRPDQIAAEIRKVVPNDALFSVDSGTTCLQVTDQLPCRTVPSLIAPLDCGMIGFSYAAGLGAKVAAPHRTVISFSGDGAFGMTMGEMSTAVMHNINSIAIVMDNGAWGSEIAYQRDFYNNRFIAGHVMSPRFDEVMKLCGGNGYFVTEPGGTADAVKQAMAGGKPAVIHIKVDPEAVLSFRKDALRKREA